MCLTGHVFCNQLRALRLQNEGDMDSDWKHQKHAITTDQKNLTDDDHIHEIEKAHLQQAPKSKVPLPPEEKGAGQRKK